MVVTLLKLSRWFPLSKLEIIYLPPNISLTRWRLVGHNCKRKRRFWLRRYLLSRLPQIPPYLKDYCVIANGDRCWYTRVLFVSILALILGLSVFPFSLLASFALVSPCPSLFCLMLWWGCMTRLCLQRVSKKNKKNKRKTQKLGWLWEPDRSCERKAGDRRRESLPGFASVFRSRPVIKPCPVRRSLSLTRVDSIREKSKIKR